VEETGEATSQPEEGEEALDDLLRGFEEEDRETDADNIDTTRGSEANASSSPYVKDQNPLFCFEKPSTDPDICVVRVEDKNEKRNDTEFSSTIEDKRAAAKKLANEKQRMRLEEEAKQRMLAEQKREKKVDQDAKAAAVAKADARNDNEDGTTNSFDDEFGEIPIEMPAGALQRMEQKALNRNQANLKMSQEPVTAPSIKTTKDAIRFQESTCESRQVPQQSVAQTNPPTDRFDDEFDDDLPDVEELIKATQNPHTANAAGQKKGTVTKVAIVPPTLPLKKKSEFDDEFGGDDDLLLAMDIPMTVPEVVPDMIIETALEVNNNVVVKKVAVNSPRVTSGFDAEFGDVDDMALEAMDMVMSQVMKPVDPHPAITRLLVLEVTDDDFMDDDTYAVGRHRILRLFDERSNAERWVHMRESWKDTLVNTGDHVNVVGAFDDVGVMIVNDSGANMVVAHPDILIAPTRVSESYDCMRKAVLAEKRSTVLPGGSGVAMKGNLVHELFQWALKRRDFSESGLLSESRAILKKYTMEMIGSRLEQDEALEHMKEMIPRVGTWGRTFMTTGSHPYPTNKIGYGQNRSVATRIKSVIDIEENIWSPAYGLKGKVDVTMEIEHEGKSRVVPFELKTGKKNGVKFRGQLGLYSLMMAERRGEAPGPGLLHYLKTCETEGFEASEDHRVALMQQRNTLASNLVSGSARGLPKMTENSFSCKYCDYADSCLLYYRAAEEGTMQGLSSNSTLKENYVETVSHLSAGQLEHFLKWEELIELESKEGTSSTPEIWGMSSEERAKTGRCFANLSVTAVSPGERQQDKTAYTFSSATAVSEDTSESMLSAQISTGDMVVCSTEDGQFAISTGFVQSVQNASITVVVDDHLRVRERRSTIPGMDVSVELQDQVPLELQAVKWRIDRNEMAVGFSTCKRNLLKLFVGEECTPDHSLRHKGMQAKTGASRGHSRLRELVVDLMPPEFHRAAPTESHELHVNQDQAKAVHKVLSARDYALILGMPGTGKTTTIAYLVEKILTEGKTVLISSYTHSAVDNVLLKLQKRGVDFLRVGRPDQVHPNLADQTPLRKLPGGDVTVDALRALVEKHTVVATTCLGVTSPLLQGRTFDYCILDEASQVTQPVCLGPLYHARTFVLVGDHYQLPPLVRNVEAKLKGMDVSLFRRLSEAHPEAVVHLASQYRMNSEIMLLSNTLIYSHRLRCGTAEVAKQCLHVSEAGMRQLRSAVSGDESSWILKLVDPAKRVVFLDTDDVPGKESSSTSGTCNHTEANLIAQIMAAYQLAQVKIEQFGVISPYRAQLKVLIESLKGVAPGVEILTVDKYQGRDKDCIIISMVRSNDALRVGKLLRDWQRANVAFTRARCKLIIIGSASTLASREPYSDFIKLVEDKGWIMKLSKGDDVKHESLLV